MNTATARVIPFTGTRNKRPYDTETEKGTGGTGEETPQKAVSMDIIDRFDENLMHLEAFLQGIYNTALADGSIKTAASTIMIFCTMAQDMAAEMEKVFREITEEGGKING